MPNAIFDAFIERQTAPISAPETPPIDWDQERREWVRHLDDFYNSVQQFLRVYIAQGKVKLHTGKKRIHEEYIGKYEVKTLTLEIGSNKLYFDPIGTNLIAAKGRVDMRGARGTVRFVLEPEDATGPWLKGYIHAEGEEPPVPEQSRAVDSWVWRIATPPPKVDTVDLCEESFQNAVMEVVNG